MNSLLQWAGALFVFSGAAAEQAEDVPKYEDRGTILARVEIAGKAYRFDVDTGSEATILDKRLKRLVGPVTDKQPTHTPAGDSIREIELFKGPLMKLWKSETELPEVGIIDLSALESDIGIRVDGILGMTILRDIPQSWDFSGTRLIWSTNWVNSVSATTVPFEGQSTNWFFYFSATANGIPLRLIVDTGAQGSIDLNPTDWETVFGKNPPKTATIMGEDGFGNEFTSTCARLASLQIGDAVFTNLFCSRNLGTNLPSSIGLDFLRRHRVFMDFPNSQLTVERPSGLEKDDFNMTGIHVRWGKDGLPFVKWVESKSSGEEAGVRKEDRILKLDGKGVWRMRPQTIFDLMRKGDGQVLELEIQRNGKSQTIRVTLRRVI